MARMMTGALEQEAFAMERLKYGAVLDGPYSTSQCPKRRAPEPTEVEQPVRKVARKWQGALRGQSATTSTGEVSTERWRRKVVGSRQLASDSGSGSEPEMDAADAERLRHRAMGDIRRRRAAGADVLARVRRRRRHHVIHSDESDDDEAEQTREAADRGRRSGGDRPVAPTVCAMQMAGGKQGQADSCSADEGGESRGGREDDAVDEAAGWFDSIRRWWRER